MGRLAVLMCTVFGGPLRPHPDLVTQRTFFFMPAKKSSTPNRAFKVADQIQRDLTELIARELKDPRVGMVTIQAVEVTPDYAHAKIFFSVLVGDPQECQEALNQAAGFLRNGLFKRLHIHTVPTLHFQFDRTTERAADMNALIAKAVSSRAKED
jgi:ribosome-binding factor A